MLEPKVDDASGLDALAAQVKHDLELLNYPERAWLPPRRTTDGEPIYDVVIVGAGQGGLAAAFGAADSSMAMTYFLLRLRCVMKLTPLDQEVWHICDHFCAVSGPSMV